MAYFETSTQYKQLAAVGREMMDFSENYGKEYGLKAVTDAGLRTLNNLSYVGAALTRFGATFGTTQKDFSEDDRELIVQWMQKSVVIDRKDVK